MKMLAGMVAGVIVLILFFALVVAPAWQSTFGDLPF